MGDASAFVDLLASLRQGGPEFAGWWKARKLMKHPKRGLLRFGHASFQANNDPALKLSIHMPV